MRRRRGIDDLAANLSGAGAQGDHPIQNDDPLAPVQSIGRLRNTLFRRSVVNVECLLVSGPGSVRHSMVTCVRIKEANYITEPPVDQSMPPDAGALTQERAP